MSLTLILSGGVELKTTQQLLSCCKTISNMLEALEKVDDSITLTFHDISAETMKRLITYAQYPPSNGSGDRAMFLDLNEDQLVDLINAANFLEYRELIVACEVQLAYLADDGGLLNDSALLQAQDKIDDYIPDRLRKAAEFFRLTKPLMDKEEVDEMIRETKWCLEK